MSFAAVHHPLEDILPHIRQPARLIGGESGAGLGFTGRPDRLRVVVGFPDTYEIGISNQALQILYALAGVAEGVEVERTYLPWVDAIAAMRREDVVLPTMETWTAVRECDLLGITLQHESNYTGLLEMIDLAGLAVLTADRGASDPLVVIGGPTCANFLPLCRFVDAVAVGDGEEVWPEILDVLSRAKAEGADRAERKRLLTDIEGVFVPGISATVVRRAVARLEHAFYPDECIVPLTAGVHDRAWVEIMRGCTRGCRFCQAGMWYRPVRERSPDETLSMAAAQLRSSGHQELALASLSTTDYSRLEEVLVRMAADHPEVRVSLPSLRVDSAAVRLAALASPTGPSLTLAPEAGSQRMRDVVNKNVTESDILAAVEEAVRAGRTTLKLYFMMGLPWETDADVVAIADLCLKIRALARDRLGPRASRLQLNVSVNNFIPKPFTPFQWAGMTDRVTLARRQGLLRARIRGRGVRLALSGPDRSYPEAALARGDEGMGAVIHEAWRRGARFDSWTEQYRADAWGQAFESAGTSAEELATTMLPLDAPLPWDVIRGVVDREFLAEEWRRAERGESTPDCRWEGCVECGACPGGPANDLARPGTRVAMGGATPAEAAPASVAESATGRTPATVPPMPSAEAVAAPLTEAEPRHRYVAGFAVTGRGRFLGHLDRVEVFRRAVRKAGGRIALSAGMRPKPRLSLALPLAVGLESIEELAGFELSEDPGQAFFEHLAAALPTHMELTSLEPYGGRASLPARVVGASYEVKVRAAAQGQEPREGDGRRAPGLASMLEDAAGRFAAAAELQVTEEREGRARKVDVKKYVDAVDVKAVEDDAVHGAASDAAAVAAAAGRAGVVSLTFTAAVTPSGTARPERVVDALAGLAGLELDTMSIVRTKILVRDE